MTLVLYDFPQSGNARKVRLLLAELGLEPEHRYVPFTRPRPDWYVALNPFAGVPALQDGDVFLAESHAILRYLALREGRDDLYPAEPARRARVEWALDAFATHTQARIGPLNRMLVAETRDETGASHPERADPERVAAALPDAREGLAAFEAFCADDGTVCGGGFTIADCAASPVLLRTRIFPLDLDAEFPKLARVRDAVAARPTAAVLGP